MRFQPIVFKFYTWRFHRDVSRMLYHRKTQNCLNYIKIIKIVLNCFKLFQNYNKPSKISKFGYICFGLWGWGRFSECGLVNSCSDSENGSTTTSTSNQHTHHHPVYWPHHASVIRVFQIERAVCFVISVPVPWVCLLCHYQPARWARSVPACQRVIQMFIQMSWKPRCCATVPDGSSSSSTRLYSWFGFCLLWWNWLIFLSCDGLLAVFVTIYCFKSIYSLFIV